MKLGIIVGRSADTTEKPYLKGIPKKLMGDNDEPPADVAIAWYIKKTYPKINVDIITPSEISLARLNKNDFIYVMYDLIDAYNEGGIDLFHTRTSIYSKTTAIMYPTVDVQKLIISKSRYYKLLDDHNIPVVPFISIPKKEWVGKTVASKRTIVKGLLSKIAEKEWPGVIAKPELGSYGTGIKIYPNISRLTPAVLLKLLDKSFTIDEFEAMLFQRYIEEFPHYFEIRTYWINGVYKKSVGTIIDYKTLGTGDEKLYIDTPKNEGGDIPSYIIDPLKKIGEDIIKVLPKMYGVPNLMLRMDFGCCQHIPDTIKGVQPDMCKKYFLNEVELTPNLFPDYGDYDIIKGLGDALVVKATSLVGKPTTKKVGIKKATTKKVSTTKKVGIKKVSTTKKVSKETTDKKIMTIKMPITRKAPKLKSRKTK